MNAVQNKTCSKMNNSIITNTAKGGIYKRFIKRSMDFVLSLLAIIVLSPLMIIIAVLVRIKLGSPVLFKQERPGLNEKIFTMYKFRTMTNQRDENGNLLPDSLRLTKFGKMLRSTSLDELPELFNILKGDMSLVGPRPLAVSYLPFYNTIEKQRHNVKPGLTGLAQVNGRNSIGWEQKFKYDYYYVNNISFILDIKIIVKTFVKVIKRKGIGIAGVNGLENFSEYRKKEIEVKKLDL
jgi:undecaprenyl phosphate N,N'-diacetylbacillosamine 1-phosphate transferase